jgi:hypothetical protein
MPKSDPPISRQAQWQRKHKAMGLCTMCSRKAFRSLFCRKHYELRRLKQRLCYSPTRRGRKGGFTDAILRARVKELSGSSPQVRKTSRKPRPKKGATARASG